MTPWVLGGHFQKCQNCQSLFFFLAIFSQFGYNVREKHQKCQNLFFNSSIIVIEKNYKRGFSKWEEKGNSKMYMRADAFII